MINRRSLLKGAALGVGGLLGLAARRRAEGGSPAASNAQAAKSRVTLAVETSMFRRHRPPEAFAMIRRAGYRFVELAGPHFRAAAVSEQSVRQLKQQLVDAGLTAIGAFIVHPISTADEKRRQEAVARWRQSIDAVDQLGLRLVTTELTGDSAQPTEGEAAFRKSMDELLPVFEKADIHLSAEPHPGDFFEAARPTLKLLRSYGSKHLGYLHCMPHTFYLGDSIREVIVEADNLLTHVHVADTFRTERIMARSAVGKHLHLIPGLGEVDFRGTFDALGEIGYGGHVSVQLISHVDRPAEAAVRARDYLQKLLGDRLIM